MSFTKITTADLADKGVVGLPDTPNLSVTALQKKFDEIATDVIVPKFNNLVDELDDFEETADLSERVKSDEITNIRTDSDDKIQISRDNGTTWVSPSSSGHIIMDGTGRSYDQRSRLQFSANTVITDKESDNATFIQIPSGIKGDKGDAATIQVGTVTDATTASVTNVGSDKDAIFNFELPKGKDGNAATIQVGTVVTGTVASVSNRGTSSSAIFDFVLPKGDKGDTGTSFQIKGMYATYADLIAAHPTGSKGDAYAVGTSTTNTIYNWDTDQQSWVDLGGLKGAKGDDGAAATLTMGTVTTLDPDQSAYARNDGTTTNAILSLGLPKGAKGDTGAAATIAVGTVAKGETASVTNAGTTTNAVFNFVLPQGDKGDAGSPSIVNGKSGDSIVLYSSDIYHNSYTATTGDITSTDSVLECIEKLDGNLSEVKSDLSNLSNGSNVKVTFDSSLVGKSATLTKGTKVYTKTVGTDSTCLFKGIEEVGTFTLACDGNTMSVSMPCYSYYEFELGTYGFQGWLDSAGITTSFTSLDEVLADEKTLRILFTKHDSVDYLVEWEEADSTVASILNNDLVAKWINLRDYALDTLYASTTCKALMDTYDKYGYGELALIGQVPILSSNTSSIVADSEWATEIAKYLAFDNNSTSFWCSQKTLATTNRNVYIGYTFNSAINVRSVKIVVDRANSVVIIQGKNSGEWENIPNTDGQTEISIGKDETINLKNSKSYLTYRVLFVSQSSTEITTDYGAGRVKTLQFLAYAPKGNVPIMTSNSAPYGSTSASAVQSGSYAYYAFDNSDSNTWWGGTGVRTAQIQYHFTNPICVKKVYWKDSGSLRTGTYKIEGSNDGSTWVSLTDTLTATQIENTININNDNYYIYYRFNHVNSASNIGMCRLQFYGRSLSVSVPTMTSNTSPWGEAIATYVSENAYKAFNGTYADSTDMCGIGKPNDGNVLGYDFGGKVVVKNIWFRNRNYGTKTENGLTKGTIVGSNDKQTWTPIHTFTNSIVASNETVCISFANSMAYRYIGVTCIECNGGEAKPSAVSELQFYCLDYSEHSERHYLYDHGIDFSNFVGAKEDSSNVYEKRSDYLYTEQNVAGKKVSFSSSVSTDLSSYNLMRINIGEILYNSSSSSTQIATVRFMNPALSVEKCRLTCMYTDKYNQYIDISSVNEECALQIISAMGSATTKGSYTSIWVE